MTRQDDHPLSGPVPSWPATIFAAAIAGVAWAGLILNLHDSYGRSGSLLASAWILLRFFTITTNVLVAVLFTGIALRRRAFADPRLVAPLSLSVLLVGIVFKLLLEGNQQLVGIAVTADTLLHRVTPILVPLYWLVFVPKGRLRFADPWLWTLYPLAYLGYALARAGLDGIYPYPFMNVSRIGAQQTAINAAVIGLGFLATSFFWVWLDRMLRPRRSEAV